MLGGHARMGLSDERMDANTDLVQRVQERGGRRVGEALSAAFVSSARGKATELNA